MKILILWASEQLKKELEKCLKDKKEILYDPLTKYRSSLIPYNSEKGETR